MNISSTGNISSDAGQLMFEVVLTPADVGGPLVIPKENADKQFPAVTDGRLLRFIDPTGKNWLFRCTSNAGRLIFSGGWGRFALEKELVAGDTVSFWRVEKEDGVKDVWYVKYAAKKDKIGVAHQVFDEMPKSEEEQEKMFDVVLTPSDVSSRLNRLLIRREHGVKHFPAVSLDIGSSTTTITTSSRRKHLLSFIDPTGKAWRFNYSHSTNSHDFVISKGWRIFVQQKKLGAGDMVSFWRAKKEGGEQDLSYYYINYTYCSVKANPIESHKQGSSFGSCLTLESNAHLDTPHGFNDMKQSSELSRERVYTGKLRELGTHSTEHDRALLYRTLFPDDYEFEKDTLVQLWMAGGLFEEETMEYFAGGVFESLLLLGHIQLARNEFPTNKALYKFKANNLVEMEPNGSYIMIDGNSNLNDIPAEVSKVSLKCGSNMDSIDLGGFKRFKQLHTLLFVRGHESSFKHVPRDLFLSLELLRVLDLSRTHISELPSSIANIKHLRYLDISNTPIKRLPETIDCLGNLQTLKLNGCSNLSTLPKGMRKLVSLRHLNFDVLRQLSTMPQGMGTLTSLRTLSAFLVGEEDECSLRQLKHMNNLTGSFCISRLENVLTGEEAMDAHLSKKRYLRKLELHWSESRDEDILGEDAVLSSLQPNASLEELVILSYGGFELPTWIYDPSFSKLVSITFSKCENCLVLPSLGQLPALKLLKIVELLKVKTIDDRFCGEVGINQGYAAFPKLETLTIEFMPRLEEWSATWSYGFPVLRNLTIKHCPKLLTLCTVSHLYSLENLEIICCPVLASFSQGKLSASVKTLIIEHCPSMSARLLKDNQDWPKIAHVPNVWVDHQQM